MAAFNLILLGDPGSGKGTQAAPLVPLYHLLDLDMGKALRSLNSGSMAAKGKAVITEDPKEIAIDEVIGKQIAEAMEKGVPAPTEVVQGIFKQFIAHAPPDKGILFNGTPKMLGEAQLVYQLMGEYNRPPETVLFLYLHISDDEILHRLQGRARPDDNPSAIAERIKYTANEFQKVVGFFKDKYEYKLIDGMGPVDAVHARIIGEIEQFISQNQGRHS